MMSRKITRPSLWDMTTPRCATHSLQAFMTKDNGRSNSNKTAVYTRAPVGNALTIIHKCGDSVPFKAMSSYKRRENGIKRYTQNSIPKTTSKSKPFIESFSNLIIRGLLANNTIVYSFSNLKLIASFTPETPLTTFVHRHRRGT